MRAERVIAEGESMKINYNQKDIRSIKKNKYGEKMHVFRKSSEYFAKFSEFVRNNTNFLDSRILLLDVYCVCDMWMYDERAGKNVRRFTKDKDGNYVTNTDYLILWIAGGKNGPGEWHEYLEDMTMLFGNFAKSGYHAYLLDMDNDCADDVFYANIAVK